MDCRIGEKENRMVWNSPNFDSSRYEGSPTEKFGRVDHVLDKVTREVLLMDMQNKKKLLPAGENSKQTLLMLEDSYPKESYATDIDSAKVQIDALASENSGILKFLQEQKLNQSGKSTEIPGSDKAKISEAKKAPLFNTDGLMTELGELAFLSLIQSVKIVKDSDLPAAKARGELIFELGSIGSSLQSIAKGTAKGFLFGGGAMAAGYAADQLAGNLLGYEPPKFGGIGRLVADGVGVPALLMSSLPGRYKYPLAATLFAATRFAGYLQR